MVTAEGTASVLGQSGPAPRRAPGWLLVWATVFGISLGAVPVWAQTATQSGAQTASEQPTLVIELGSHSAPVRRIDVHPGRGVAVTASDDRTARIWDLATGELRHVLRPLAAGNEVGRLYGAAVHPMQPLVAVAGTSGGADTAHLIYLFDVDSGALRRTIDAKAGDIRKLVWSADGTVLLAGYSGNPASNHGVRAFALDGRELLDDRLPGPVFGLAVAASGQAAAVGLDGTLRGYRVGNGAASVAGSTQINGRRPAGVSFSPDGSRLAVAYATPREGPEIFDSATLGSVGRLPAEALFGGDWRVLAWSADGRSIYVGGTAHTQALRFAVLQFDLASARVVARIDTANDSITDLRALPSGEVAYTSFDGSWGVIGSASEAGRETTPTSPQVLRRVGAPVATVRGNAPLDLALSDDARTLRWGASGAASGSGLAFAFDKRRLQTAGQALPVPSGPSLRQPDTRFGLFNAPADWNQESRPPVIGGRAMALAADERGRALAVLRATPGAPAAAIVGTNRALYRVSEQGGVTWRVPVDTEIRALNASADGRFLVGAMADATVRWWRASDGQLLLTLLAQADGRWVVWTPSGYYDASAGADRLVGWALPRGQQQAMSYFSLNRFRDRFNRPDLIDAIFTQADESAALAALAAREEQARLALQTQARDQADAARAAARAAEVAADLAAELAAERAAREQARQAELRDSDKRAAAQVAAVAAAASREAAQLAEAARAEESGRAAAERSAKVEAQRNAQRLAAEQAAQAEATRLATAREALARAAAEQAARDSALRAEESRLAEAQRLAAAARAALLAQQAAQQAAQQQARAEQQEAEREAARKLALARAAAEREAAARQAAAQAAAQAVAQAAEQAAALAAQTEQARLAQEREQAARVAQAREQAAREQAQRQAADREAARLLAESQAAAIATAQREAAQRAAALEAQRLAARLEQAEQARVAALREAASREAAAQAAAREAAQQMAAAQARKALQALKAAEFPPALQAVSALRFKATAAEVSLSFALLSTTAAGDVDVQVRSNGRPTQPAELVMPKSVDGRTQGLARIQVGEGRTQIEILASNRYGVSEPLVFVIDRDQVAATATAAAAAIRPALPPSADLYVLAIGVADYARAEYKLGLAAKDARDFGAAMQRQEGRLYRRVIVRTLTDKGATRAAVLRELDLLRSTVTAADVAMVFIAGHGINDRTGTYYFLPHDGQHERLATTAVAQDAIVSGLSRIRGKTILFVDTCFAGNALGALTKVGRQTEKLMNDLSASENGVVVFASSTGHEESEEKDEWGNGAFTKALLDGLSGKADFMRAGRVTYAGLNLFVSEEVARLTSGRQRPVFISPRGIPDFAVARL